MPPDETESTQRNRRTVLKGLGVGAAGVTALGLGVQRVAASHQIASDYAALEVGPNDVTTTDLWAGDKSNTGNPTNLSYGSSSAITAKDGNKVSSGYDPVPTHVFRLDVTDIVDALRNSGTAIGVTWTGSGTFPTAYEYHLDVYNLNTGSWETVDKADVGSAVNKTLRGDVQNVGAYLDTGGGNVYVYTRAYVEYTY